MRRSVLLVVVAALAALALSAAATAVAAAPGALVVRIVDTPTSSPTDECPAGRGGQTAVATRGDRRLRRELHPQ